MAKVGAPFVMLHIDNEIFLSCKKMLESLIFPLFVSVLPSSALFWGNIDFPYPILKVFICPENIKSTKYK